MNYLGNVIYVLTSILWGPGSFSLLVAHNIQDGNVAVKLWVVSTNNDYFLTNEIT